MAITRTNKAHFYQKDEEIDVSSSGDFTSGTILVERINRTVTITFLTQLDHASMSTATSASGLIPEWARPNQEKNNTYAVGATTFQLRSFPDGKIRTIYLDDNGSNTNRTNASELGSITYSV